MTIQMFGSHILLNYFMSTREFYEYFLLFNLRTSGRITVTVLINLNCSIAMHMILKCCLDGSGVILLSSEMDVLIFHNDFHEFL